MPGTIFAENGVRVASISDEEIAKVEQMCSPQYNPVPWNEWRERLNGWANGINTYQAICDIAREIPKEMLPENVEPRRWWKSA